VTRLPRPGALAVTYGAGAAAAVLAAALRVPLASLLGPLLATGVASALGRPRPVLPGARQAGQAVVGAALGLYFSAEVLGTLGAALPWMAAAAAATLGVGIAGARLLRRRAALDPATAFYASVPGGAAEMAIFGERAGGDPAVIALSQSLRIAAVVTVLPLALGASGVRGDELWAPAVRPPLPYGPAVLVLLGLAAAHACRLVRVPNGWFLGFLAASAFLTASGVGIGPVPRLLLDTAQVAIGCALGSLFRRELLRDARVLLPSLALGVAQGMALLAGFAAAVAAASGRSTAGLLLATAPGGIAEMCLTARTLRLGVPLVTAFHVVRLVAQLTLAPATFRLWFVTDRALRRKEDERWPSP
jgi:membrane AbrB-like protein